MRNFVPAESIFYHIYPLGFCDAPLKNTGEPPVDRISAIEKWIPHMKSLGVNALYLGPIFQSGYHGYDTWDYRMIDTRLGTNEDFVRVSQALRNNDISLILDGVFNHVGRGFFAFQDVLKNRENSPYCSWISSLRFDMNNSYGDNLHYDSWAGHEELVKLNLGNPDVREMLLSAVDMWIDEFHISGLRLDAADCIDREFFKALRQRTLAKDPSFWLLGEITSGNYTIWANPDMLHSVTNYECYKGLHSSITSKNMFEIAHSIDRQFGQWGLYKNLVLYNFVDNHDVSRIASILKDHKSNIKNLYTIMYAMPGVPSIYYGSEWGIEGEKKPKSDSAMRPPINVDAPEITDRELMEHISELSKIRLGSEALKYGDYKNVQIGNDYLVFARTSQNDRRLVFINIANEPKTVRCDFEGRHFEEYLDGCSSRIITA